MSRCIAPECHKDAVKRAMCNSHYLRWWKYGDLSLGGVSRGGAKKFILDNLNYESDECLVWPFFRNEKGYGDVKFNGCKGLAHRVICTLKRGTPPSAEYEAAHQCGNGHKGCVNPNHIFWKTRLENIHDKEAHGTQPWGEKVHFAKLTCEQAREIKYSGMKTKDAAKRFSISRDSVYNIRAGRTWKNL